MHFYVYDALSNRIYRTNHSTYRRASEGSTNALSCIRSELTNLHLHPVAQSDNEGSLLRKPMRYPINETEIAQALCTGMNELVLEITQRCNLRCRYCIYSGQYLFERTHSMKDMPLSVAKRAIDLFLRHSSDAHPKRIIAFYGGEPLLAFELVRQCIKHTLTRVSANDVCFSLTTNGVLLTEDKFQFLASHNVLLHISLDGPEWIHDRHRVFPQGTGSYSVVMQNLDALCTFNESYYRQSVYFVCTITDPTALSEISDFFESNKLTQGHSITPSSVHKHDLADEAFLELDRVANESSMQTLRTAYTQAILNGRKPNEFERGLFDRPILRLHTRELAPLADSLPPNGVCLPGTMRLFVQQDGQLFPCERCGATFPLGDVSSWVDVSRVVNLVESYCRFSEPICTGCWAVRHCPACYIHAQRGGVFDSNRKMDNCSDFKAYLHNALVMYSTIMERSCHALDRYLGLE